MFAGPSALRTSDWWRRFINDAQSARGDARQRAAGVANGMKGRRDEKLGKKGSFSEIGHVLDLKFSSGDLHLDGRGRVCLGSAMQVNPPKATMREEVKNTQRQKKKNKVLATRHS